MNERIDSVPGFPGESLDRKHSYWPTPDPATGNLIVDPDIVLKGRGLGLEVDFLYNARDSSNGPYGKRRSCSLNAFIYNDGLANFAQAVRGSKVQKLFAPSGTSGGITTFASNANAYTGSSLSYDASTQTFIEQFPGGEEARYQIKDGSSTKYSVVSTKTPAGAILSYSYGTGSELGLLKTDVPLTVLYF